MPESSLRFSVISEEQGTRAASWKLWTPSGRRDVYLACRELQGALKLSLHESGSWHFAYDRQFFEAKVPETHRDDRGRFIDKWTRPAPIVPGTTLALRIVTPWTALTRGDLPNAKVLRIPPPKMNRAREVYVFLVEPPAHVSGWPGKNRMGTEFIGSYTIADGISIWAVHMEIPCPDFSGIPEVPATPFNGVSRSDISSSVRAIVYGDNVDGSKVVYDLAGHYSPSA